MKLMVSAKPFVAELKSVLPAIATRSGLPMLSGVRLEVSVGEVSIEATDLELTARLLVCPGRSLRCAQSSPSSWSRSRWSSS